MRWTGYSHGWPANCRGELAPGGDPTLDVNDDECWLDVTRRSRVFREQARSYSVSGVVFVG